jgi:hypothetical protein
MAMSEIVACGWCKPGLRARLHVRFCAQILGTITCMICVQTDSSSGHNTNGILDIKKQKKTVFHFWEPIVHGIEWESNTKL